MYKNQMNVRHEYELCKKRMLDDALTLNATFKKSSKQGAKQAALADALWAWV